MWKIYNKAEGKNGAEILLYDTLAGFTDEDYGYVSAKKIIGGIKALSSEKTITLRINSAGGDVIQAFAVYNALRDCHAGIVVKVDGIAASAASVIAMAGDKIIMPENSMMMLHNPWGIVSGDAEEMRDKAEILDKIKGMCIEIYRSKSGLPAGKLSEIMDSETYLTAEECRELKLCDEVSESIDIAAEMKEYLGPVSVVASSELAKIKAEIQAQERERIKALDELMAPGREAIIERAKYEEPKEAKDIALELLKADGIQAALGSRFEDSAVMNKIRADKERPAEDALDRMVNAVSMNLNKMRGYVKDGRQ